jgi:hypothetical protein
MNASQKHKSKIDKYYISYEALLIIYFNKNYNIINLNKKNNYIFYKEIIDSKISFDNKLIYSKIIR